MLKLILKDSLHFDKDNIFASSNMPLLYFIYLFNFASRSSKQFVFWIFYVMVILLFTLFPIRVAKGLYLCPLTENDRKKYLMISVYFRFGLLMLLYGVILIIAWMLYKTSGLILLLQYIYGGIIIFALSLIGIHPGINSIETAMQVYYQTQKIPINIKPKLKKLERKTAVSSMLILITILALGSVGLLLLLDKKVLNPYLWLYYIPSFICCLICIFIYYRKYINEVTTICVNREIYTYLKKKAGVFHAD